VKAVAAEALALAGDVTRTQKLADDLNHNFPLDTLAQGYGLPIIRSDILLHGGIPPRRLGSWT
jgi:hypothetical protein